jgi:hypothetical protein
MFKKEKPQPQFYLSDFRSELNALVAKALGARVHLVDIRNALDDQMIAIEFAYAQRPVV